MEETPIKKSLTLRVSYFFIKIILSLFFISFFLVFLYRYVPVPYTPLMLWRSTASFFTEKKGFDIQKKWVPLTEISKTVQNAVIRAEDYKFYEHNGFDFEAIEKAIQYNKTHHKKKGASTISQQTAKNIFLWPSRSWVRKGLEAYFTVLIEFFWTKKRILECYLNVIELGKGVYGVEAASKKYFKKSAAKLNIQEAALIAAVLPNPIRFKIEKPSRYVLNRQKKIMGAPVLPPANLLHFEAGDKTLTEEKNDFLKFENVEDLGADEEKIENN